MDRVEVVSTNETVKTPAGTFEHCVHLRETTPLERGVSHKYLAPGIGIIQDDEFELAERPATLADHGADGSIVARSDIHTPTANRRGDERVIRARLSRRMSALAS